MADAPVGGAAGTSSVGEDAEAVVGQAKQGTLRSLHGFQVSEVLNDDPQAKFGGDPAPAIALLARKPFDKANLVSLASAATSLQPDFANDIYSKYVGVPPAHHSAVTVDIIYPATDKHIRKYRAQRRCLVVETPELYERVVRPYIQSIPPERLAWVYNVLEKKKEVDRLIFEDADPSLGFMLHPDLKWDQAQLDQLYCLALVHRRDLHSLRDLTADQLPLLENIRAKGCQAIADKYGVPRSSLRVYMHYQPSYYHLHVHFTHMCWTAAGALAGKAILLDDIIDNLKTFGCDFYQRKTLTYVLGEEDELWRLLGNGGGEGAGGGGGGSGSGMAAPAASVPAPAVC